MKAYIHHLQVPGKTTRPNGSPSTEKVLDSFFFGLRTSGNSATMHKIFLEGNKYSLCGVAKLCNSRTFT